MALLSDVAVALATAGDWWGEAERCRLLGLREPGAVAHVNNRANALWLHDDPWAALPEAERAVTLAPDHSVAWRCLGNVLQDLGRLERALQAYGRSLALQPDPATAFNCSKVLMGLGRYAEAYVLAEQRLQKPGFQPYRPGPYGQHGPPTQPLWLWSEQGFGDGLQFLRWVVPLLRQGRSITLELEPSLVRLAAAGLAWAGGDLQVQEKVAPPAPLPSHAVQGSLLSVPLHLAGVDPQVPPGPYLRLPCAAAAPRPGRQPRLGLVWASGRFLDGHVLEREYRRKSLLGRPLQSLLNALALRPVEVVSLQFGPDSQPPAWIGTFAAVLPPEADFYEAALRMLDLDLVISVDTASAHLAGALGLPVWTLLPWAAEARWQRQRSDSPWYPSMRLLRQPSHQDWYGLIQEVLARLDLWLSQWPVGGAG